jgi:signal transduction histidine kinase/ligand-binding sensor domain-containing protein
LSTSAVAAEYHHTKWTSENGLGAVFDIQQSPEGYLWLTTSRGVVRFDGVRFQTVSAATFDAVDTNEIDSVYHPPSGGLWLTTMSAGPLFWKDGRLTTFPDRHCTPTRKMGRLAEDLDGALWVQNAAGLFRLHGSVCEQIGAKEGYPGGFASGLFIDHSGTVWVKTRSGPLLFRRRGEAKFQVSPYGNGTSASYAFLHEAPDGTVWMSDEHGLRRVAGKDGASALAESPAKPAPGAAKFGDFTFAPDGTLWAVASKGVQRFDHVERWAAPLGVETAPGEIYTPAEGLSSDAAWKVLVDREGSVWIATNSGLDRLRRNVLTKAALPPVQEREFSIAVGDDGGVWTGNGGMPLTHIAADGSTTTFPKTRETLTVRRDHNGTIWSAGAGEAYLWRVAGHTLTPLHYPDEALDSVAAVATDRNNDPWITTRGGKVYRFTAGEWANQNKALGKKPGVIGAMTDDQAGNVWFAFSDRVVQWDGAAYHVFTGQDRNISETTMSARNDRVWLGGPGGVQLVMGGRFHAMRWKDPELPGRVSGVVETRTGDLWVNGFSGVAHVAAAELQQWLRDPSSAVAAEHFDELDGLPGLSGEKIPEPSVVEGSDGRIWFATTKGVAWLRPAALETNRNRVLPPVLVTTVTSNGKIYAAGKGLVLPAHTENLEIDYTALSLAMAERVLFRYRLEGVDHGWQDAGTRRQAYYTKLRPGPYTFRVMACNQDGVWNEAGAVLNFALTPAWFQTIWFRGLCVVCVIAALWSLYQLRACQITAGINARFNERLAERNLLAQELHDTLLQGFLSASMQVHVARDRLPDDSPVKAILTRSLDLMRQVIEEGRTALRTIRSNSAVGVNLEEALMQVNQEMNIGEDLVEFRLIVEDRKRPLKPLVRDEIYRIGREALTNAFRHAEAGRVEIELQYNDDFRLLVRDDGRGIDQEAVSGVPTGRGLVAMREHAGRIGGRLRVWSKPSAGTEVSLTVPGSIAYECQTPKKDATPEPQGAVAVLRRP